MTTPRKSDAPKTTTGPAKSSGPSMVVTDMSAFANTRRAGTASTGEPDWELTERPLNGVVRYGKDNLYPEYVLDLVEMSVPLGKAVAMNAFGVVGAGMVFADKDGKEDARATAVWDQLTGNDDTALRHSMAFDLVTLGWCAVEVRYNGDGAIVGVEPLPVNTLRKASKEDGLWYVSKNWKSAGRYQTKRREIWEHGHEKAKEAGRGVACLRLWNPRSRLRTYGVPPFVAAIPDAELVAAVAEFNRVQLDFGFAAGAHIHLQTAKTGTDLRRLESRVIHKFTGPRGQPVIVTNGLPNEPAPTINALPLMNNAGKQEELREAASKEVFRACGVPGVLADVEVGTGFDGKSVATREAVERWQRLTVEPFQAYIERFVSKLVAEAMGPAGKMTGAASIMNASPIAFFGDSRERERYMTRNEYRAEAGLPPKDGLGWDDRPARDALPEQKDGPGVAPVSGGAENEPN